MTRTYNAFALLLCWASLALPQVPVEKEPHHTLAISNEWVRVFEPRVPPGDSTLDHLHLLDDVTICISGARVRTKTPATEWTPLRTPCAPGFASFTEYAGKPLSHTLENLGDTTYHLTLIENEKATGWTQTPPLRLDGMRVTGESRAFRVYQVDAPEIALHSHGVPVVVVNASGKPSLALGDQTTQLTRAGEARFVPAGAPHRVVLTAGAVAVEVEIR